MTGYYHVKKGMTKNSLVYKSKIIIESFLG